MFDEQRESDESQAHSALDGHGVDLNSHLDVFNAILNQVRIGNGYLSFRQKQYFICSQCVLQSCYHNFIVLQVLDTPQEVPFLSILQHLLRIDPKEPIRY